MPTEQLQAIRELIDAWHRGEIEGEDALRLIAKAVSE